jgi:hypothetical protein
MKEPSDWQLILITLIAAPILYGLLWVAMAIF